jgi:hypothetical protein
MLSMLSQNNSIIAIDLSEIKFEVYTKDPPPKELFNAIHKIFF